MLVIQLSVSQEDSTRQQYLTSLYASDSCQLHNLMTIQGREKWQPAH